MMFSGSPACVSLTTLPCQQHAPEIPKYLPPSPKGIRAILAWLLNRLNSGHTHTQGGLCLFTHSWYSRDGGTFTKDTPVLRTSLGPQVSSKGAEQSPFGFPGAGRRVQGKIRPGPLEGVTLRGGVCQRATRGQAQADWPCVGYHIGACPFLASKPVLSARRRRARMRPRRVGHEP